MKNYKDLFSAIEDKCFKDKSRNNNSEVFLGK